MVEEGVVVFGDEILILIGVLSLKVGKFVKVVKKLFFFCCKFFLKFCCIIIVLFMM